MTADLMERWFESGAVETDFFGVEGEELRHLLRIDLRHPLAQANRRSGLASAEKELAFTKHHGIRICFAIDDDYPLRLKELQGAPSALFAIGNGSLDMSHALSVVGTRRPTPYGAETCRSFVGSWCDSLDDLTIISGLAYGIDAVAHTTALEHKAPTIAVLAHGLDRIYPAQHRDLAQRIIRSGGLLLTEYPSKIAPFKRQFLERNRIVAALSDATVVIESGYRGGALSTANVAFNANREVFALPGRVGDEMSEGCNKLIANQKAHILTSADSLLSEMRWESHKEHVDAVQKTLFPVLSETQLMIHGVLKKSDRPLTPDDLCELTELPMPLITSTLGDMEFDGIIIRYPGNRYSLN